MPNRTKEPKALASTINTNQMFLPILTQSIDRLNLLSEVYNKNSSFIFRVHHFLLIRIKGAYKGKKKNVSQIFIFS